MNEEKVKGWQRLNYAEMLEDLYQKGKINKDLFEDAKVNFKKLDLTDKKVDGYTVEGLPKTDEGKLAVKINYTDIFHSINTNKFTPVLYLVKLIETYRRKSPGDKDISGFLARGIRSLSSLMREPIFAEKLENILSNYDKEVTAGTCPVQDAGDHTDVLLKFKGETYRIWLYQFSDRGLPHDIERVTGQRGELPNGVHVLCPLITEYAKKYDRLLKKNDRLEKKLESKKKKLSKCSVRAVKKIEHILKAISETEDDIVTAKVELEKEERDIDPEIKVVAGWYFYSDKYIERLAEKIINDRKFENYERVRETLMMPKKYLAEIHFFEKRV